MVKPEEGKNIWYARFGFPGQGAACADQAALGSPPVSSHESGDRGFKPHRRRAWLHLGLG